MQGLLGALKTLPMFAVIFISNRLSTCTFVVPVEIIKMNVSDYWDTIVFTEEAKRKSNNLYGEDA